MWITILAMINPHLISPPISILQAHPWLERRSSFRLIPRWTRLDLVGSQFESYNRRLVAKALTKPVTIPRLCRGMVTGLRNGDRER
jgi:hypothetical protein